MSKLALPVHSSTSLGAPEADDPCLCITDDGRYFLDIHGEVDPNLLMAMNARLRVLLSKLGPNLNIGMWRFGPDAPQNVFDPSGQMSATPGVTRLTVIHIGGGGRFGSFGSPTTRDFRGVSVLVQCVLLVLLRSFNRHQLWIRTSNTNGRLQRYYCLGDARCWSARFRGAPRALGPNKFFWLVQQPPDVLKHLHDG